MLITMLYYIFKPYSYENIDKPISYYNIVKTIHLSLHSESKIKYLKVLLITYDSIRYQNWTYASNEQQMKSWYITNYNWLKNLQDLKFNNITVLGPYLPLSNGLSTSM